jgi:hypothetical protein
VAEARWLRFLWTPERQEIAVDGEAFAHPEATGTTPSHDVAHLLAAASGLAWKPSGARDDVCRAEYNAVFIENLVHLDRAECGLERTIEHARWFVEQHYAPFPVTADAAVDSLVHALDVDMLTILSPVFFRMRAFERSHPDFLRRTYSGSFSSQFRPSVGALIGQAQRELRIELERFLRTQRRRRG